MEPHPIPQNVTSFEFHLVGDMTLKQFIYLGAGLGMAYLLYATVFFVQPFVAAPLMLLTVLLGVAFAFLPIHDRPFDHWVGAFFKAVYSPTKGSFKIKYNPKLKIEPGDPFLKNRLQLYLASMGMTVNLWDRITPPVLPVKKMQESEKKETLIKLPTQQELTNLVEMAKESQILQGKISDTEKLIKQMTNSTNQTEQQQVSVNLKALLQQTEELYDKTSRMTQVTTHISQPQIQPQTQPLPPVPKIQLPAQPTDNPRVVIVQPLVHKTTQVALTSTPNVINGIVSDEAGNFIENVIVIIHDKEGLPVRALKTNKLGQFAGATPLPLGVYTITLEKEQFSFQTLQLTLDNTIIAPLQIIAKKGGQQN